MEMKTWLSAFASSIQRHLGEARRRELMRGSEELPVGSSQGAKEKRAAWLKTSIDRLDSVTDAETACKVLVDSCPHIYSKGRIDKMRKQYEKLGSIDKLLEVMRSDTSYGGGSFYDYPRREGDMIHVTKVPCNPRKHAAASTDEEKRLAYCHCSMAKGRIGTLSPTFCCCSGGWVKQLWEGVLRVPLEVSLTESLLKGDERCTHSFRVPAELL